MSLYSSPSGGTTIISGSSTSGTINSFQVDLILDDFADGATYDAATRQLTGPAPVKLGNYFNFTASIGFYSSFMIRDDSGNPKDKNGLYEKVSYDSGSGEFIVRKMAGFDDDEDHLEGVRVAHGRPADKGDTWVWWSLTKTFAKSSFASTLFQPVSSLAPRVIEADYLVDVPLTGTLVVDPDASPPLIFNGDTAFPDLYGVTIDAFKRLLLSSQTDKSENYHWYLKSKGQDSYVLWSDFPDSGELTKGTRVGIREGRHANTEWALNCAEDTIYPGTYDVRPRQTGGPGAILLIKDPLGAIDTGLWETSNIGGTRNGAIVPDGVGLNFAHDASSAPESPVVGPTLESLETFTASDIDLRFYFKRNANNTDTGLFVSLVSTDTSRKIDCGMFWFNAAELWTNDEGGPGPSLARANASSLDVGSTNFNDGWLRMRMSGARVCFQYSLNDDATPPTESQWVDLITMNNFDIRRPLGPFKIRVFTLSVAATPNAPDYSIAHMSMYANGSPL